VNVRAAGEDARAPQEGCGCAAAPGGPGRGALLAHADAAFSFATGGNRVPDTYQGTMRVSTSVVPS